MADVLAEISPSFVEELGAPIHRSPQPRGDFELPAGTVVVSADNHFSLCEDIWYERFPSTMKEQAPRVWFADGVHHAGIGGRSFFSGPIEPAIAVFDSLPGSSQIEARMADPDAEGIDKEIVFGNVSTAMAFLPDLEVRELTLRIYNEYMAELAAAAPGRFYGVGYHNFWDPSRFQSSIDEIVSLGLKTFLLPVNPVGKDGAPILWADESMDDFWSMIEESGLPVCFHIGENAIAGRGGIGTAFLMNLAGFQKTMGQLIFGGIFDRHPRLRVTFMEAGIAWVAAMLQDAERIQSWFGSVMDWKLQDSPRSYWHKHCYAVFMTDPVGVQLLDVIGSDRVMWCADYPHAESTFGYSWSAMREVVRATSEDAARRILGATALELFDLPT